VGLDLQGGNSFPFDNIGDRVSGTIIDTRKQQQTNLTTGEPEWWDVGQTQPKEVYIVVLKTDLRDGGPADDGTREVWLYANRYTAVKQVTNRLDEGAKFALEYVADSDKQAAQRGHNKAKLYKAWYEAPKAGTDLGGAAPAAAASSYDAEPPF
jgi:hypothetical protein